MSNWTSLQILMVLVPTLPLLSAVVTAVLGPKLLGRYSHWPTILALAASSVASLALLNKVNYAAEASVQSVGWSETVTLWNWADVPDAHESTPEATSADGEQINGETQEFDFAIDVTLRADPLTAVMLAMVTFIATLVAIYAAGYMQGDRGYWRFFSYVSLFVFSMTMLVSVSNFILLYVFWEAVGACSYFLIGFWYEKPEAAAAGKKAFLVNRVGDFGFALALFLIWTTYGTLNFHDTYTVQSEAADGAVTTLTVTQPSDDAQLQVAGVLGQSRLQNPEENYVAGGIGLAICLLLMLGACGKSAQFPLHVWLPDAMEGPTPVSALIHAATMVTAGVYMVTRCTPLFAVSPDAQFAVACIGAFTALLAGIIAFTQNDLKRVLAYSTVSQLGYMFLALGTGSLVGIIAGMFHLFTHAFFKALLFLGAGSVMHAMGGVIDMRRFGGLRKLMPATYWTFLIGCMALSGIAPLAGFWSKDAILHEVHHSVHGASPWAHYYEYLYYAAKFTALLTVLYTFRAFFLTFHGEEKIPSEAGHHAHESPPSMCVPLMILAVGSMLVGFFHSNVFTWLQRTPSLAFGEFSEVKFHALGWKDVIAGSGFALIGVALAAFFYLGDLREVQWITRLIKPVYHLSYGKFFVDQIYNLFIVWPLRLLATIAYWIDRYVIDGLVNLTARVPLAAGAVLRSLQPGLVQFYAMMMVLGLLVLIGALFV